MLSSNRGHYLAIGGCLAFLLLAIPALGQETAPSAVIENSDAASENGNADTAAEPDPGAQSPPETEPASGGEVSTQPAEPVADQGNRYPNCEFESVEECDLAAQQSMAESTAFMNRAAWVGIVLTVLGLALLWRTMRYTKDAANYAKSAADAAWETVSEARGGTDATRRAAASVNRNTVRELRAYIAVVPDGVNKLTNAHVALGHVWVRNVGKLPASKVTVYVHMEMGKRDRSDFPVEAREHGTADRVVQPNAELRQGSPERLYVVDFEGEEYVFVWGAVYYEDGFGEPRHTRFCHRYNLESLNPDTPFAMHEDAPFCLLNQGRARYHEASNDAS